MTGKTAGTGVLLISPPFAMPDKPCIGVAALAAYLSQKDVPVRALDLNLGFFREFLPDLWDGTDASASEKLRRFKDAVRAAMPDDSPERLDFNSATGYIRYHSAARKFSSKDLLDSIRLKTLGSEFLERSLPALLGEDRSIVAGISVAFPDQIIPALRCARIIRERFPETFVVLGGSFVSCHMRGISEPGFFDVVDGIVLDDGEVPLTMLYEELRSGRRDFGRIPNLMYRNGSGIVRTEERCIESVNNDVDYSVFPLGDYLIGRGSMGLLVRLTHGCYWARCAFCKTSIPLIGGFRRFDARATFETVRRLHETEGVRAFHFTDDSAPPDILEDFSRSILDSNTGILWAANIRCDEGFTLERCMLYARAGCRAMYVGVESFSERLLGMMKKGTSPQLIERTLSNVSWAGMNAIIYMIVGFPTETVEEACESFDRARSLKRQGMIEDCIYNVFEISPFSEIARNPGDFGITSVSRDPEEDLNPAIADFESTGMPRDAAFALRARFSAGVSEAQ